MKFLPILLAVAGTGAGIGAGIFLMPAPEEKAAEAIDCVVPEKEPKAETVAEKSEGPQEGREYIKLSNQFVIPVMSSERVQALVVASFSIEVPSGGAEGVYAREPKLRDAFLQVLFDHANIGGFEGRFTDTGRMLILREALRDAARNVLGNDVFDVLITEIARQDA